MKEDSPSLQPARILPQTLPRRWQLALISMLLFAIYGVSQPYLQILLRGLGYDRAAIGLLLGIFEVAGIAGPLFIARAADRTGKSRIVLGALAILIAASMLPLSLVNTPLMTALALVAFSLGLKTLIPVSDAAFITILEEAERRGLRGYKYGRLRAAGSGGFVVVALILQAVPGFDDSPPWVIGLWTAIVAFVFIASLSWLPHGETRKAHPATLKKDRSIKLNKVFLSGLAVIALGRLAMTAINSFFSLYLREDLGWGAVGGMWALSAAVEIPLMLVAGRFITRLGPMGTVALSSAAIAVRLAIYAVFPTPAGAITGQLLHSLCYGIFQPAAVVFVTGHYPPPNRATGMAIYMGLAVGVPTFAGSALGGLIAQAAGYRWLFASFIVFALASVALYFFFRNRNGRRW
jgi:PPP family 3-phenylpropionic acid transporter